MTDIRENRGWESVQEHTERGRDRGSAQKPCTTNWAPDIHCHWQRRRHTVIIMH